MVMMVVVMVVIVMVVVRGGIGAGRVARDNGLGTGAEV